MNVKIHAQALEFQSVATGILRASIRTMLGEINAAPGDRFAAIHRRVSGIMAKAQARSGGTVGVDTGVGYTDGRLLSADGLRLLSALGRASWACCACICGTYRPPCRAAAPAVGG